MHAVTLTKLHDKRCETVFNKPLCVEFLNATKTTILFFFKYHQYFKTTLQDMIVVQYVDTK